MNKYTVRANRYQKDGTNMWITGYFEAAICAASSEEAIGNFKQNAPNWFGCEYVEALSLDPIVVKTEPAVEIVRE